jgi:hypothetical protein
VQALLPRRGFRHQVLQQTSDPMIPHWFETYFEPMDARLRLEIISPRYASSFSRTVPGEPTSNAPDAIWLSGSAPAE